MPVPGSHGASPDSPRQYRDIRANGRRAASGQGFDTATNEYIACLQRQNDTQLVKLKQRESDPKKRAEQKQKRQRALIKQQSAAVDVDQALAARFNEQLRAFKAKEASKAR